MKKVNKKLQRKTKPIKNKSEIMIGKAGDKLKKLTEEGGVCGQRGGISYWAFRTMGVNKNLALIANKV